MFVQMTVLYEIVELALQQDDLRENISSAAASNSKTGIVVRYCVICGVYY